MNKNDPNAQKKFQEVSEAYEVCLSSCLSVRTLRIAWTEDEKIKSWTM